MRIVSLVARLGAIVADILVLFVTWSTTLRAYNMAKRNRERPPLIILLIRDGMPFSSSKYVKLWRLIFLLRRHFLFHVSTSIGSQSSTRAEHHCLVCCSWWTCSSFCRTTWLVLSFTLHFSIVVTNVSLLWLLSTLCLAICKCESLEVLSYLRLLLT